jgi:hypothetical protein
MPRSRRVLLVIASVAAMLAGIVAIAVGDVDPASDVLLQQDWFVPYQPQVCTQLKDGLASATRRASDAGYHVKVAVIGSQTDLGAAPQFFGHPAPYADFLGRELGSFSAHSKRKVTNVPLLVVMPQGFALWPRNPRVSGALKGIAISRSADPNTLTRAAVTAVPRLASAAGHPVPAVSIASGCSHKSNTLLLFVVPIALLVLAGLLVRFVVPRGRGGSDPA